MSLQKINICQPGYGASCSFCCGSHNYKSGYNEIDGLFRNRSLAYMEFISESKDTQVGNNEISSDQIRSIKTVFSAAGCGCRPPESRLQELSCLNNKLLDDGIQCEYIGYIDKELSAAGCLIYQNAGSAGKESVEFFNRTCKVFLCPASEILSGEEIVFAARLMRDWYYYSLLINEINILKELKKKYNDPGNVPRQEVLSIKENLQDLLIR